MMRTHLSIIAILLAASLTNGHAADSWTRKADFGGAPRGYAVGFSIGNKGYMGTGFSLAASTYYKDWWKYDPATNVWTQKADFGGGTAASGVGFAIDGMGYVLAGGFIDFWQFDPVANTWTQKATFPGVARLWAVGFSIGNNGYVGTGNDLSIPRMGLEDFWEYDPVTDTWTRKADLPGGARYSAAGFSIGSKGYIGIGDDNDGAIKYRDFWEYDPASDSWTRKADFVGAAQTYAVGLSIGSKGYIGTGNSRDGSRLRQLCQYDPTSDTWTRKAPFGGLARAVATGFSIAGKGYIGTGLNDYGFFRDFWEYDPGDITLRAARSEVGGINTVLLTWSGATSANIDVYRNSVLITNVPNTHSYIDSTGDTDRDRYEYRVCEAGSSTCSNVARVWFPQ
jgi:Galactose oxidase, central domain